MADSFLPNHQWGIEVPTLRYNLHVSNPIQHINLGYSPKLENEEQFYKAELTRQTHKHLSTVV